MLLCAAARAQEAAPRAASQTVQPANTAPQFDATAPLTAARGLLESGDYAAADTSLREIIRQAPQNPDAHFFLGFALLHEGKPKESLNEYSEGAKYRAPGADEMVGAASDYIALKDWADAEKWLTDAAKEQPDRPTTWYLLGRVQFIQGRWAEAVHSLATCVKLDPKHLRAQYNLGLAYERVGEPENALAAYRAAIALADAAQSKDPQPYLDLGSLLRRQGKATEAVPLLEKAAHLAVRNPLVHKELGLAYEDAGRNQDALREMRVATVLAPDAESLHFLLGRLYSKTGHGNDALREFAAAAELGKTTPSNAIPNADVP